MLKKGILLLVFLGCVWLLLQIFASLEDSLHEFLGWY